MDWNKINQLLDTIVTGCTELIDVIVFDWCDYLQSSSKFCRLKCKIELYCNFLYCAKNLNNQRPELSTRILYCDKLDKLKCLGTQKWDSLIAKNQIEEKVNFSSANVWKGCIIEIIVSRLDLTVRFVNRIGWISRECSIQWTFSVVYA